MKPATVERKLAALRSLFRFLIEQGVLTSNPAAGAGRSPRPRRSPPLCLSAPQVREALDAVTGADDFTGTRDRAIAEVVYGGGLRLGELVGLSLTSLALDEGTVIVPRPDGGQRQVPIGSKAVEALRVYLMRRADLLVDRDISRVDAGALFLNDEGKRLHRRSIQRIASRFAAAAAGRPASGLRLLRNSFAAHLLEAGADAAAVGRLLGQSTLAACSAVGAGGMAELQAKYDRAHPRSGADGGEGAD